MEKPFFENASKLREKLRENIRSHLSKVENGEIRHIILQRNSSSYFIKGTIAYYLQEGLRGDLSDKEKIEISSGLEILCSAGAILDNVIDEHYERNNQTTYLREYGNKMQIAASQYVLHYGLKLLFPFLNNLSKKIAEYYKIDLAVLGMVGMDIKGAQDKNDHIKIVERTNGLFNGSTLALVASVATTDLFKIDNVFKYGFNLGSALGFYEELRDLFGEHGRKKGFEIEQGRKILPFYYFEERFPNSRISNIFKNGFTENKYRVLINELISSGAIKDTESLIERYVCEASKYLKSTVTPRSFDILNELNESIVFSLRGFYGNT